MEWAERPVELTVVMPAVLVVPLTVAEEIVQVEAMVSAVEVQPVLELWLSQNPV
jgi:hypothetical protein